jgi:DNA excision repair protein ERCC-4
MRFVNHVNTPVRIVADDRENAGGVMGELRGRDDVALEVRRLGVGDFLVEDNFAVERKTLRDFAASVIDARLFKQAGAMAVRARRGIIVLEGTATTADRLGVPREALQGALITVSVFYGLAVLRASDQAETTRLLIYYWTTGAALCQRRSAAAGLSSKGQTRAGALRFAGVAKRRAGAG